MANGLHPETLKDLPACVLNRVIGSNRLALDAARRKAEDLGFRVVNLGSFIQGETKDVAARQADMVRDVLRDRIPLPPPLCILSGGETTVTLGANPGKGGRNQEFALAFLLQSGESLNQVVALAGGTDGEDGPTDAAGGIVDAGTWESTKRLGIAAAEDYLRRHDAYTFLDRTASLLRTGLTQTNVMELGLGHPRP